MGVELADEVGTVVLDAKVLLASGVVDEGSRLLLETIKGGLGHLFLYKVLLLDAWIPMSWL